MMETQTTVMSTSGFSNLSDVVTAITSPQESIPTLETCAYSNDIETTETNPYSLVTTNGELSVEMMNTRQLHFIQLPDGSLHPLFNDENLEATEQVDEVTTFDALQALPPSDYEIQKESEIQADSTSDYTLPIDTQETENNETDCNGPNNGTGEILGELMLSEESRQSESQEDNLQEANKDENNSNTVVIDVSNPIQLCQNSLIVVDGKRCLLQHDLESGQMLAYPIKEAENPMKKRRGRPRRPNPQNGVAKSPKKANKSSPFDQPLQASNPTQQTEDSQNGGGTVIEADTSTAETGFIEKANEEGEIVKRSARKRKKTALLAEYETNALKFQCSSDDDYLRDQDEGDEALSVKRRRNMKKSVKAIVKKAPATSLNQQLGKRGRGRPRRYGLKPPEQAPTQTFLIHTSDGHAVMIKVPLSNLSPGKSLQHSAQDIANCLNSRLIQKDILPLAPKPIDDNTPNIDVTIPLSSSVENQVVEVMPAVIEEPQTFDESRIEPQSEPVFETEMQTVGVENGTVIEQVEINHQTSLNEETINALSANGNEEENVIYPISVIMTDDVSPVKIGLKAIENDLEKLKCPKCNYQAYYQIQYQEHIMMHPDDVQQCKCCDFLSFTQEDLLDHYNEQHPKCICKICNHVVAHPYVLKRHMYKHTDMSATCDTCGKVYRDRYILKMHVRNVHMPVEEFFECPMCNKKFTRKAHLRRHIRTHNPNKPYKCDQCEYRGSERSDITKHKLIHEEPKYICPVCGRTFRHVKNMELHMKRHNGQRDYQCGVCEFSGYTFTDIRKHIGRKHTDSKTIICCKCGQAFMTEQELQEHRDSDQCELFMLEQALQEPEQLEDSSQPEADLIGEEGNGDQLNAPVAQDAEIITSITFTDESNAALCTVPGITGRIVVNDDMVDITASQLINSDRDTALPENQDLKSNQSTLIESQSHLAGEHFTIFTDTEGNTFHYGLGGWSDV